MCTQTIFEIRTNPLGVKFLQLVCLLFILLAISLHFTHGLNYLGTIIIVGMLLLLILGATDVRVVITSQRLEIHKIRLFKILSTQYVAEFKDIESIEHDRPEVFYLGYLLGASSALLSHKNGNLVLKFKNGTYKKIVLFFKASQQAEIFKLLSSKINKT